MNAVSPEQPHGLSSNEAQKRLLQYGLNRLPEAPLPGVLRIFMGQFSSPFIYILLIAAIASFSLNQVANSVFILLVLLLNAFIGTYQEYSAQRSAAALRQLVQGHARVIRDGTSLQVQVEQLVPGDFVVLESGDKIPADLKLMSSRDLGIDESMLTGESVATQKSAQGCSDTSQAISAQSAMCFAGTMVTRGRGMGTVVATAMDTQLGKIAHLLGQQHNSEPPLMIRIRRFTYQTAAAILVAILLLVGIMLLRGGYSFEAMAMVAIGLAVSAIPEGLPAALTVALSIGMGRMAKLNVIIRKLVAVEALGSCTFICSDKTGTLTVNELTIRKILLPRGQSYDISGEGVSPGGEVINRELEASNFPQSNSAQSNSAQANVHLNQGVIDLCTCGVLANESHLEYGGNEWTSSGDIVDVAFLVLAKKAKLSVSELTSKNSQVDLIPYESENAFSASYNLNDENISLHVKGSPEKILSMCTTMLVDNKEQAIDTAKIENQFNQVAANGYRIIALAKRKVDRVGVIENLNNMVFIGMVAMIDPVRPEAKKAISRCRQGGIEVAMVTGDHPATAKAIAVELGLCQPENDVVTGDMIRLANQQDPQGKRGLVEKLIFTCRVFARIEPQQKQQIVKSFMNSGHFVAVTGDGVNDAPAMRESNVGVAMGKRGTDVAKETAQLIITDDNFASIVNGIEQGRIVYNNIRKVIALLVATGFSALLLFFLSISAGFAMPLTAVQLLWLNLVANGVQDVALAFEPKEGSELLKPPRKPSEAIFEKHIIEHVLVIGGSMGLLAFAVVATLNYLGVSESEARNLTLLLMVMFGNIHALSSRSETQSLFKMLWLSNPLLLMAVPLAQAIHVGVMYLPGLRDILEMQPVTLSQWSWLAGVALLLLLIEETHKWKLRRQAFNKTV